jgi:hypothetical protein
MIKDLTTLLQNIDPGTSFRADDIAARIKAEVDKALTGGMDRAEFERQLFAFGHLPELPIWHLFDQRVRMPEAMAREILCHDPKRLHALLRSMLSSRHMQGADLVAEALGLEPYLDAERLIEAHQSHPDVVRLCLSGLHGDAAASLAKEERTDAAKLRPLLMSTAIYYGALQLQLIGVRLRALDEFSVGVEDRSRTGTMGAMLHDLRQLIAAIKKARDAVASDGKLRGRQNDLLRSSRAIGEAVERSAYLARPELTGTGLLDELRQLYRLLGPTIDAIDAILGMGPKETGGEAEASLGAEGGNEMTLGSLRERVQSALTGGVTGGEQLAFASLRLHAYARRLPKILDGTISYPSRHENWFRTLAGDRNKDVAKLVLVSRSAVWAGTQYPPAYGADGGQYDLRDRLNDWTRSSSGATPNVELLWKTKQLAAGWKTQGPSASENVALAGVQRWDIHPGFYFNSPFVRPASEPRGYREPRGFQQTGHLPSPQHRAKKRSHRPC